MEEHSARASQSWRQQPELVKQYFDALSKLSLNIHKHFYPDHNNSRRKACRFADGKKTFIFKAANMDKIMRQKPKTNKINKKRKTNAGQKRNVACGENGQNVQGPSISQQQCEFRNESANVLADNLNFINTNYPLDYPPLLSCNCIGGDLIITSIENC